MRGLQMATSESRPLEQYANFAYGGDVLRQSTPNRTFLLRKPKRKACSISALSFGDPTTLKLVRPERFELPTPWFEAKCSIQMSYGRTKNGILIILNLGSL